MTQRMEELRHRLTLLDDRKVVLRVADRRAWFECETCGDMLDYASASGWWQCPSCEYELTVNEAVVLVTRAQDAINQLCDEVSMKGGRWPKKSWWSQLFR